MEPKKESVKKKAAIIAFSILSISAIVALYMYHSYSRTHISTDDAFVEGDIYTIASKVSGTVSNVYVNDNQPVKKGDLLVTIDPSDYEAKLKEAEAASEVESAKLIESNYRIEAAKKTLLESEDRSRSAIATLAARKADLEQAQKDAKRAENLYARGAVSKEKYEKALTALKVLASEANVAERQLRVSQEAINTQSAVAAQTEAFRLTQGKVIEKEQALLTQARLNYNYTRIYSPVEGYVNKKAVEVGNQIQASQPLMAIIPLEGLWVVANYKETQLARIKPGQRVSLKVDAYPGKVLHGKVDSFMAGTGAVFSLFPPENATGHYVKIVQRLPIKIVLDNASRNEAGFDASGQFQLRMGMSVVPTVITE